MIRRAAALAGVVAASLPAAVAGADAFTPIRIQLTVTPIARLHAPLTVTVHVTADPGVLDVRNGPMRMHVILAGECGGTFATTPGVVLLNKVLSPQPTTGRSYSAVVRGSGRPAAYGAQTVCAYLDDNYETFATDNSHQVDVSPACTAAAARYDKLRRKRRHNKKQLAADQRAARRACGPGVPL